MLNHWSELEEACLSCRKCALCETRNHVVFGVGNPKAQVMFVGEGPGENEDLQGEPFVGRGGQLLDKLLAAVDLDRKTNVYITNIVKCRPLIEPGPQARGTGGLHRLPSQPIRPAAAQDLGVSGTHCRHEAHQAGHQNHQGTRHLL